MGHKLLDIGFKLLCMNMLGGHLFVVFVRPMHLHFKHSEQPLLVIIPCTLTFFFCFEFSYCYGEPHFKTFYDW